MNWSNCQTFHNYNIYHRFFPNWCNLLMKKTTTFQKWSITNFSSKKYKLKAKLQSIIECRGWQNNHTLKRQHCQWFTLLQIPVLEKEYAFVCSSHLASLASSSLDALWTALFADQPGVAVVVFEVLALLLWALFPSLFSLLSTGTDHNYLFFFVLFSWQSSSLCHFHAQIQRPHCLP